MYPPITDFWGKASSERDTQALLEWHPLIDHCLDVACVFQALTAIAAIRSRLERAAGQTLSAAHLERLAVLALAHDLGKLNRGFQSKIFPDGARTAGHSREVGPLFQDKALPQRLVTTLDLAALCDSKAGRLNFRRSNADPDKPSLWKPC